MSRITSTLNIALTRGRSLLSLCLLLLMCCGTPAQTVTPQDGPWLLLNLSALPVSADQVRLSVDASDPVGVTKSFSQSFMQAPLDSLGVLFPIGTRGPVSFRVDAFSGTCLISTGSGSITLRSDDVLSTTVTLSPVPFCGTGVTLTVQVANIQNGNGTVSSSPTGINCDATGKNCTLTVAKNTPITLSATNTGGTTSSFNGWSGGGCSGTGTCVVPMAQDTIVQAVFTSCRGWCKEPIPASVTANLNGVGGNSAGNVIVVGDGGTMLNWDGLTWKTVALPSGQTPNLRGVAGKVGFGSVDIVGDTAKIYKWNTSLTQLTTTSTANLTAVTFGSGTNNIAYVVGSASESLLIATTGAVTVGGLSVGTSTMNTICATPGGDFLVGGAKGAANAVAALWDGSAKTTLQMVAGAAVAGNIYAMVCGSTYYYAAGDGGAIVRRSSTAGQDNAWTAQTSGVTRAIRGMWYGSDTFIVSVGDNGTILQFDGTSWKAQTSGVTTNLRAVWGTSPTNILAVGDSGIVLRYTP